VLTYQVKGPTESGHYLVGYPTPGAPQVFTLAGCATSEAIAMYECDRLNEAQVADRRAAIVRQADMIALDCEPGKPTPP
jgi:hypothetical protein